MHFKICFYSETHEFGSCSRLETMQLNDIFHLSIIIENLSENSVKVNI